MKFEATAIFGLMTGEPIVEVEFAGQRLQLAPDDARSMATILLEAAEAAESDACLVHCLTDMGMGRESAGQLLIAMRQKRAELKDGQNDH